MPCPFETLGISPNSTKSEVLRAWRQLMLVHHPDKEDPADKELVHRLNEAKDMCLIQASNQTKDEHEFAMFISRIIEQKCDTMIQPGFLEGRDLARMIKPRLGEFMHVRAVDTMEWVLLCGMGEMEFSQRLEDHIPVLCKYYNSFIGQDNWSDNEHTFMTILNRYEHIKAKGIGNFARRIAQ